MRSTRPQLTPTLAERRKSIELLFDFKWRSVNSAIDLFTKLVTYFFTLLAIVLGFVFTQKVSPQHEKVLVYTILLVAVLYVVVTCAFGWGVYAGLKQIRKALREYDEPMFERLQMDRFVKRGVIVGVVVSTSCVLMLVVICGAVISRIYCPNYLSVVCAP